VSDSDVERVTLANTAFYDSLESGDLDRMSALWLDEEVSCVHPGWHVLRGRSEVLRSFALLMANTEYIQFFLTDVEVVVLGDTAMVTCTENILSGGPADDDGGAGPLIGGLVVATNVFHRTTGGWRLWAHHGSPVMAGESDEDDEEPGDSAVG
jgi:ketosteroid isomerase-like protein